MGGGGRRDKWRREITANKATRLLLPAQPSLCRCGQVAALPFSRFAECSIAPLVKSSLAFGITNFRGWLDDDDDRSFFFAV